MAAALCTLLIKLHQHGRGVCFTSSKLHVFQCISRVKRCASRRCYASQCLDHVYLEDVKSLYTTEKNTLRMRALLFLVQSGPEKMTTSNIFLRVQFQVQNTRVDH